MLTFRLVKFVTYKFKVSHRLLNFNRRNWQYMKSISYRICLLLLFLLLLWASHRLHVSAMLFYYIHAKSYSQKLHN